LVESIKFKLRKKTHWIFQRKDFPIMVYVNVSLKEISMYKMQEEEFDKIKATKKPELCNHEFVKLYTLGTHSDYGCLLCKVKTLTPELFCDKRENE